MITINSDREATYVNTDQKMLSTNYSETNTKCHAKKLEVSGSKEIGELLIWKYFLTFFEREWEYKMWKWKNDILTVLRYLTDQVLAISYTQ